jgi:hypothetical protein
MYKIITEKSPCIINIRFSNLRLRILKGKYIKGKTILKRFLNYVKIKSIKFIL